MMTQPNSQNERIKRKYFEYMRETLGLSEDTIDHAAAAIREFEEFTGFVDFKKWSRKRAIDYKKSQQARIQRRQKPLSPATVVAKLRLVKNFHLWLATQPGYRSKITRSEANYLAPRRSDSRMARAPSVSEAPTVDQVRQIILSMPAANDVELRSRALIAFCLLTGVRVSALITLKMKHLLPNGSGVLQDAREVRTKFSKTQETFFFRQVGEDVLEIFQNYAAYMKRELGWGDEDPLFPATDQPTGDTLQFEVSGLARRHWKTPSPVRTIFKRASCAAGLPYFPPHTIRTTLARLGEQLCSGPEELKVWSQNLGHDKVLTTMMSYGSVTLDRQRRLMETIGPRSPDKFQQLSDLLRDPEVRNRLQFDGS